MWIKKFARYSVTVIERLSQVAGGIAIVFLMAIMMLTVVDVVLRFFFNIPIPGSLEISQYFMVIAGFLGLAWCAFKGGHVKVNLIISKFSARTQAIMGSVTMLLSLTVLPLIAYQCFVQARYVQLEGLTSDLLEIPEYPFYIVMGTGFLLLLLVIIVLTTQMIIKAVKK